MNKSSDWIKTHCARMDHGGCGILVKVAANQIKAIKGDPDGYLNQGYICPKAMAAADKLNHPMRLKNPVKRIGARGQGKWQKISWNEALSIISENLLKIKKEYGAKAVAFCQGMPKGLEHFVLIRLANIFGSPNVVAVQDVCHAPREISGLHTCGFYPVTDFHYPSRVIVLWGSNLNATNEEGLICSLLHKQLLSGSDLIVIDPQKTEFAEKAKFWLQLKPGTDLALALGFLKVIIQEKLYDQVFVEKFTHGFEELTRMVDRFSLTSIADITGVPEKLIQQSARCYAAAMPAALQWGNPIEHTYFAFDAARALVCLMAICGNLDVAGGNIWAHEPDILGLGQFVRADLIPDKRKKMIHAFYHTIPRLMTVPPTYFKKAVLEEIPYPVKAAYMQCTNPLLGYADSKGTYEALKKLNFLAVSDIVMTPTAALADIVLPAATQFEFDDIGHYGIGHGIILARPKVVDPPTLCRPDMMILNDLGKRLTDEKYWYQDSRGFLEAVLQPSGLSYEEFVEKGYLKGPDRFETYKSRGFKTPTGKVELVLSRAKKFNLAKLPVLPADFAGFDPGYPLTLTSAKSRLFLHSSYRWLEKLRKKQPEPEVKIHPQTAKDYQINEGDMVNIETRQGCIIQRARISDIIRPGVVYADYGWWFPEKSEQELFAWQQSNYNILTTAKKVGREFGTPELKGLGCRLSPLDSIK